MEIFKRVIGRNDILRVLRIRPFLFMMISEFFSQLSFNMQHFVLIFIIYELTRSSTAVSGLILSFTIPAILFSLISGVYVDRWSKKSVLFFTNLIRGFLLLPFLIPNIHLAVIYMLTFLIAIVTQFFLPAESAIIPHLVPKNLILSANAIFSLGIYGTIMLGYIISGPILLLIGQTNTILLLAVLFFVSTIFVMLISVSKGGNKKEDEKSVGLSIAYEIKEVFSFLRRARKVAHSLVVLTIAQAVIFIFAVLGPGYVATVLDVKIESLSLILVAPAAVGMVVAAFILGSFGKKFKPRWLSSLGFLTSGLIFVLFPFGSKVASLELVRTINSYLPNFFDITLFHIVVVLAFFVGLATSFVFVSSNATIQIETGDKIRGRIYGFLNALIGAVSLLPVALAGGFADILGVGTVITSVGIFMLVLSIFFYIFD